MLLDDTAQTLARVHQKLLSLYPAVAADLVEAVRQRAAATAVRAVADDYDAGLDAFAAGLADLTDRLAEALGGSD